MEEYGRAIHGDQHEFDFGLIDGEEEHDDEDPVMAHSYQGQTKRKRNHYRYSEDERVDESELLQFDTFDEVGGGGKKKKS